MRIMLAVAIVLVAGGGAYLGWDLHKKKTHPCIYRTYRSLMDEFPELKEIWDRKIAYLDEREAVEKFMEATTELARKRGELTSEQVFDLRKKMFEESMAGADKLGEEFLAACRSLTGTE